jgi:hypothetical protein
VDDYVNLGNGSSLRIFGSSFTISIWVKTSAIKQWAGFYVRSGNAYAQYVMSASGSQRVETLVGVFNSNTPITNGNWHHIAVTYNTTDSNRIIFYLDGRADGSQTGISFAAGTTENYFIGVERTLTVFFNGLIDEVRIYNRALSDAEIQALYNATK